MAAQLWQSSDPAVWEAARDGYWGVISSLGEKLHILERWYAELGAALRGRDPPHLTKPELVKLVDWKLTRGKWRPSLLGYAQAADPEQVADASTRCLAALAAAGPRPDAAAIKAALAAVSELKGVGPATASAVLAAWEPSVPYMSDEAMLAALGSKDYTVGRGLALVEALRSKAEELSRGGAAEFTAAEVERCLYAEARRGTAGKAAGPSTARAAAAKRKR